MGKWCDQFGFDFGAPTITGDAQKILAEVEGAFRRAASLPLTDDAVVAGRRVLMQTVGRVVATGELPDPKVMLFLTDAAERMGKLSTHMARELGATEIEPVHVEDASRVVLVDRERVMEKIRARASRAA